MTMAIDRDVKQQLKLMLYTCGLEYRTYTDDLTSDKFLTTKWDNKQFKGVKSLSCIPVGAMPYDDSR